MSHTLSTTSGRDPLRLELEEHLEAEMGKLFDSVPYAREFHEGAATDLKYYVRHMSEAVIRIILNNEADAYCLYKVASQNHQASKILIKYLAEEYGHDELLLSDLELFGISKDKVLQTRPFFSTQLLMSYLHFSVNTDGLLPTMLWNWFVEWYSERFNVIITDKARKEFGDDKVEGTQAHLQLDDNLDHADGVYLAVQSLIVGDGELLKAKEYLANFIKLVGMYFQELYDATMVEPT